MARRDVKGPADARGARGARERMIVSAALLVRERGARATSIDDVLQHSGAPRGSVYHHFPGGRDELLREATRYAGSVVERRLAKTGAGDPLAAFDAFLGGYRKALLDDDFRPGCPVLAVAVEAGELQAEAGAVFRAWTDRLAGSFEQGGIAPDRAHTLAVLAVAAAEGALTLSRAQRDVAPLDRVRAELHALLERERGAHEPRRRA
jgi:AcrR family transcriptional regulator